MSYRIKLHQSVDDNVRRVIRECLGQAIALLEAHGNSAVHDARKQLKKARAALRLVRDALPEVYEQENAAIRDAGHMISWLRDCEARLEMYEYITDLYHEQIDRRHYTPVGMILAEELEQARSEMQEHHQTDRVIDELSTVWQRVDGWPQVPDDFDVMSKGLSQSYRRGRQALKRLRDRAPDQTADLIHTLRKRVKYHRYHTALLREVWPKPFKTRRAELKRLTDQLGTHRDLHLLGEHLKADPEAYTRIERIEELLIMAHTRQRELLNSAYKLGGKLMTETPNKLVHRWHQYWVCEREEECWPPDVDRAPVLATRPKR